MIVLLYMAMSLNGMIDRQNGEEDFLSHDNWRMFLRLVRQHGNLIYGRKTYEAVRRWGPEYRLDDLPEVDKVIVSRRRQPPPTGWFVAGSPAEALSYLATRGQKVALLSGGATTNAAFAQAGLIDEALINVEPAIIAPGVPLFKPDKIDLRFTLISVKRLGRGGVTLHYRIRK
ncbi:MAG: dihydrofolate reductase [Candidatus Kerfeldbacteria bacterium]|nr:dihydrofolate reductase [Candidatus Kerfeldbacteria bacterium]